MYRAPHASYRTMNPRSASSPRSVSPSQSSYGSTAALIRRGRSSSRPSRSAIVHSPAKRRRASGWHSARSSSRKNPGLIVLSLATEHHHRGAAIATQPPIRRDPGEPIPRALLAKINNNRAAIEAVAESPRDRLRPVPETDVARRARGGEIRERIVPSHRSRDDVIDVQLCRRRNAPAVLTRRSVALDHPPAHPRIHQPTVRAAHSAPTSSRASTDTSPRAAARR